MDIAFSGEYREQHDQAGVLLEIDDRNWIKAGIEFVDGRHLLGAVITREVSDWSMLALAAPPSTITLRLRRTADTVTMHYGVDGAAPETLLRLGYFPPGEAARADAMCASPQGSGFPVRFRRLAVA